MQNLINDKEKIAIPYSFAKKNNLVVLSQTELNAQIGHVGMPSLQSLAEIQCLLQKKIDLKELSQEDFQKKLTLYYESQGNIGQVTEEMTKDIDLSQFAKQLSTDQDLLDTNSDAPVIQLINNVLAQAIKQQASDIHFETYKDKLLIRCRVDGVLQTMLELRRELSPLIISRTKVMANLDIAEKRIPQDGRITIKIASHSIDIRVSTLPSNHGERIVLRILDKQAVQLNLNLLGMDKTVHDAILKMIHRPHGIVLTTGPTGSGKTTTLYSMLTDMNPLEKNILTIEDPIEYELSGIGQTQVNTKINMSFARGLRAILRQDPDVVMIGEIRDLETAEIAIQASLTGHLVLSTLHTNTAVGAITRLQDMGVEPFLLASSLTGLIAQRLVRKLCQSCKTSRSPNNAELDILNIYPDIKCEKIYTAGGCQACGMSGYKGRIGIYEYIMVDDTLRGMIHRQESDQDIEKYARQHTPGIQKNGIEKVALGITTLTEVLRVTNR